MPTPNAIWPQWRLRPSPAAVAAAAAGITSQSCCRQGLLGRRKHRKLLCLTSNSNHAAAGLAVEMEPRFYGLRNINEKEGTFEADFGIKVRWGPSDTAEDTADAAAGAAAPPPPAFHISETLQVTQLERSEPLAMPQRPRWQELFVRSRSTSLAAFQLKSFPYDVHKLRVVVRMPRVQQQGIQSVAAIQESKPTPRSPDLGLQDWLVLRQRCYLRTVAPGIKWFLRCDAPMEFNMSAEEVGGPVEGQAQEPPPPQTQPPAAPPAWGATSAASADANGCIPGGRGGPAASAQVPQEPQKPKDTAAKAKRSRAAKDKAKLEFVMEFLVQRRATFWGTSVYLPLLAMELIVPMIFAMPLEDLASRLMLAVTLVLAPTVFKTALTDRLPSVGYLTTMERHFIFAYIFILASCLVHTGIRILLYLGFRPLSKALNVVGAVGSLVLLALYHARHYRTHVMPYLKRLSMFEKRSFYAPPIIRTMDTWAAAAAGVAGVVAVAAAGGTPSKQYSSCDASDCEGAGAESLALKPARA